MSLIGHDGSEKLFEAPDPIGRQGFHVQEMILACMDMGYTVTPFELCPASAYQMPDGPIITKSLLSKKRAARFASTIERATGVITGRGRSTDHAMSFIYGCIIDPDNAESFLFNMDTMFDRGFHPQCLWILNKRR